MKLPVHRLAHDVAEDRAGRADQRADDDQQIVDSMKPVAAAAQPE